MRWIKHLSLAHADAAISYILEEYGAEGYGVWWLILEDVAAPMEVGKMNPIAIHSVVKWAQICHCSVRRFRSIAIRLAEKNLIQLQTEMDRIQIEIPNILKYRDEYSKRSGETPDQEQIQIQIESRGRSETEKPSVSPKAQPNGTRLSEMNLPLVWEGWCRDELKWPGVKIEATFQTFRDYWISQPGVKGRKTDWLATWRNWCRRENEKTSVNGTQRKSKTETILEELRRAD